MLFKSLALLLASVATCLVAPAKQHPQGAASVPPSRSVSFGPTKSPVTQRQADEYARRDLKLERDALAQRQKIEAVLPPWAKQRLELASKAFVKRLLGERQSGDINQIVKEEVGKQFKDATPQQANILTFYLLTSVVKLLPPHSAKRADVETEREKLKDKKDSISEMGEMDMLMLQQMMEKKGKLESMISNIMKAGFEGGQAAIQALKAS